MKRSAQWRGINGERRQESWFEGDLFLSSQKKLILLGYQQVVEFSDAVIEATKQIL